jgi:CBS domain-containing protein
MSVALILQAKGHDVVSVAPDMRVGDIVRLLCERRIGAVLVCEGDHVAGVLSERDVIRGLNERGAAILDAAAREIMTADVVRVAPDAGIINALSLMTRRRIRHLPVMAGEELRGVVSIGDLVKSRLDELEREAETLLSYIQQA